MTGKINLTPKEQEAIKELFWAFRNKQISIEKCLIVIGEIIDKKDKQ